MPRGLDTRAPAGRRCGRVVVVDGQAELLEVVDALRPPGRLARRLDGGQQQGDQDRDDRDHHQQLDQREGSSRATSRHGAFRWEEETTARDRARNARRGGRGGSDSDSSRRPPAKHRDRRMNKTMVKWSVAGTGILRKYGSPRPHPKSVTGPGRGRRGRGDRAGPRRSPYSSRGGGHRMKACISGSPIATGRPIRCHDQLPVPCGSPGSGSIGSSAGSTGSRDAADVGAVVGDEPDAARGGGPPAGARPTRGSGRAPGEIRAEFAAQLTDDLTSLVKSDHAGDPFTALKTKEPPSLSIEPPKPDTTEINQPKLRRWPVHAPTSPGPRCRGRRPRRLGLGQGRRRPARGRGRARRRAGRGRRPAPCRGRVGPVLRPAGGDEACSSAARGGRSARRRRSRRGSTGWPATSGEDGGWSLELPVAVPGAALPGADRPRIGHRRHRPGAAAAARRRAHPHRQEPIPGQRPPRARLAGRAPAGGRRAVHRRRPPGPACTATRSPRWRCARRMGSRRIRAPASPRSARSTSSPRRRTSTTAAGDTAPASRGTPRSSAGRCSPCAAPGWPA